MDFGLVLLKLTDQFHFREIMCSRFQVDTPFCPNPKTQQYVQV